LLNRGFSDLPSINCLLGLNDDGVVGGVNNLDSSNNGEESKEKEEIKGACG